jgi:hypothetical protein
MVEEYALYAVKPKWNNVVIVTVPNKVDGMMGVVAIQKK